MTVPIDIRELPARLEEALAVASSGGEVVLTDAGTPRARLLPMEPAQPRVAGLHAGAISASDDFDAPLPDEFWLGKAEKP
jgi:antitoxin (DNA-binding transcriptional repressor) of toxin-antitoxin stability system